MGFREEVAEADEAMARLNAVMSRGGYACLGCLKPTTNEGQICSACVGRGVRIENDTVLVDIEVRLPDWLSRT